MGAPGLRSGSDWAPWLQIGVLGITFGVSRLHFGWTWELFDALWGHLVSIWVPQASKIDAEGDQADTTKTIENHCFSGVLEVWRVILEAWRSSGSSCWRAGWQRAAFLRGWLVVAGAGWEAGWPRGPPGAESTRSGVENAISGGPESINFI